MAGRLGTSTAPSLPTHSPGCLTAAGLSGLGRQSRAATLPPDPSTQPQRQRTPDGLQPAFPKASNWLPDTPAGPEKRIVGGSAACWDL